ncbi:MAG: hypothetical protein WBA00_05085 [Rhodococcus sp. (in: high G+C Gram-positive bacteria)]
MTSKALTLDLAELSRLGGEVLRLKERGWTVTDGVGSMKVAMASVPDPVTALEQLTALLEASLNVEAVGLRAGSQFTIRLVNGIPEIVDFPTADPRELFDEQADQALALEALDGSADAALQLPMDWKISGTFSLAQAIDIPSDATVTVSLHSATITDYILGMDSLHIRQLLPDKRYRVFVALDTPDTVQCGLLVLVGMPVRPHPSLVELELVKLLDGEVHHEHFPPAGALVSHAYSHVPQIWSNAVVHINSLMVQQIWRSLASKERRGSEGIILTFAGYKNSSFALLNQSWTKFQVREALALRDWALHDLSPDRLLAVRQIVSLYDDTSAPFAHAADIQASAEMVYIGLRSDAVAEAVKGAREAHAQAQEAARQTVKNATEMLKGASERSLAALVAVGAVLMANAGRVLPDDIGRLLIVLVALFLCALAIASALLEGPLLALPARKLRDDLAHQGGLLTSEQRAAVNLLPSLVSARKRIVIMRWAVPITYLIFATLLLIFGSPGQFK